MEVKMLTNQQAKGLHVRLRPWFEIRPIPLKNGNWCLYRSAALELKKVLIDEVSDNPNFKQRALTIWNFLKDIPTVELDDYPGALYNTELSPLSVIPEEIAELEEYDLRYAELEFENIT